MISNYFKIAWRSLLKDKMSSSINIGGLAVGLAIGILIMLMVIDELSYNRFHQHLDQIHLLMKHDNNSGEISTFKSTPAALAPALQGTIPEINKAARSTYQGAFLLEAGDKKFYEPGIYADPAFLEILKFKSLEGNTVNALQSGAAVITRKTALKLFENEKVIGKSILLNGTTPLQIGAVLDDIPTQSTVKFDVVLPFALFEMDNKEAVNNWGNNFLQTWIELKPQTNISTVNAKLKKIFSEKTETTNSILFAYPLERLHLHSQFKNGQPEGGKFQLIILLSAIGFFVLLIACINFMNLATARSEKRAKEVGVRKVMGAERKSLIFQFLGEAMVMTLPSLLLALIIVNIALPGFNVFTGKNIEFDFSSWKIWLSVIAIGLFTGLIAGSYPALYLSRFMPVQVLKGRIAPSKGGSMLRRFLVTSQFTIAVFLVITSIVIFRQLRYVKDRPIGFEKENLLVVPVHGDMATKFDITKNELNKIPGVVAVSAGADNIVFMGTQTDGIVWPGKTADQNYLITFTSVHYDWAKTNGLQIIEGREFNSAFRADSLSCLVNEAAVRKMQLKSPVVGTKLGDQTIIGVVRDFVYNSPEEHPAPLVVYLDKNAVNNIFIRVKNDQGWRNTITGIESAITTIHPHYPFEFRFVSDDYQNRFTGIQSAADIISFTGSLAILISCLGLFALASYVAERRSKEISIRKVLGASATGVWLILSKDFLKPVLIGFLIATPLAAFVMNVILDKMDYRIQLSWWMFALAGLMVLIIAIFTVGLQAFKAAIANPVNSLRSE
jgi:ABC-type antimicrobial peptide transport system permease subunit